MSGKFMALAMLLFAGCAPGQSLTQIKADQKYSGQYIAQQCEGRDGWSDKAPPASVFGNVYMVGTCGITVLLITSPTGHILIDGATEETAASIAENIRKLGFNPADVKYLLSSHEHMDHVGGLAELKRITGAQMIARAEAKDSLESGQYHSDDPQRGVLPAFPGIKVDQIIKDGETVTLGRLRLRALATPGHSPGGTSWTWQSCKAGKCLQFVYVDSLGAVSADDYRFTDHPEYVSMFRATIEKVAALHPCEVLIAPHNSQSQFLERLSGVKMLVDTNGCKNYANAARDKLDKRLVSEKLK